MAIATSRISRAGTECAARAALPREQLLAGDHTPREAVDRSEGRVCIGTGGGGARQPSILLTGRSTCTTNTPTLLLVKALLGGFKKGARN
uniref:Uncharacterized protein n=1 Tax=Setaria viridis TaxID=4556 RepID=A0A4U6SYX0_SETVI|nr:hypothetical protein SEVIR_9G280800v2 [Setaria viridis]